jgi:hypothetical protein
MSEQIRQLVLSILPESLHQFTTIEGRKIGETEYVAITIKKFSTETHRSESNLVKLSLRIDEIPYFNLCFILASDIATNLDEQRALMAYISDELTQYLNKLPHALK